MRPVNSDMENNLSKNWLCCVLIGLFTLLLWGQSLRYGFVWDDEIYISKNQSIRSLAKIPVFFYSMAAQSSEEKPTSYGDPQYCLCLLHALDFHETPQPWIFHLAMSRTRSGRDAALLGVAVAMAKAGRRNLNGSPWSGAVGRARFRRASGQRGSWSVGRSAWMTCWRLFLSWRRRGRF